ncbi:MAG: LapA family protein [Paracoccaceae bacterium]
MRYLRYVFLAVLTVGLVIIAVANREPVLLRLFTDDVAAWVGVQNSISIPQFVVIFGSIITGVAIGFVWEWFREHKQRAQASTVRRENTRLEREVSRLQTDQSSPKDDVLALIDG